MAAWIGGKLPASVNETAVPYAHQAGCSCPRVNDLCLQSCISWYQYTAVCSRVVSGPDDKAYTCSRQEKAWPCPALPCPQLQYCKDIPAFAFSSKKSLLPCSALLNQTQPFCRWTSAEWNPSWALTRRVQVPASMPTPPSPYLVMVRTPRMRPPSRQASPTPPPTGAVRHPLPWPTVMTAVELQWHTAMHINSPPATFWVMFLLISCQLCITSMHSPHQNLHCLILCQGCSMTIRNCFLLHSSCHSQPCLFAWCMSLTSYLPSAVVLHESQRWVFWALTGLQSILSLIYLYQMLSQ